MKWTVPIFIAVLCISLILFTFFIDSEIIIYFGNAVQIGSLILAALNVSMVRQFYAAGDEPRKAWGWLSIGLLLWIIAQLIGSYREMVLEELPYGDFSDVFWVLGYVPFFIGLIILIRSFSKTGLPIVNRKSYMWIAIISTFIFVGLFLSVIWPELKDPERPLPTKLLDVAYPALDILLLALSAFLLKISWTLRGGSLANAWLMLCIGFAMSAIADLLLIHISEISTAYRYLDVIYFSSYFSIAIAGSIQVRTLRDL